MKVFMRLWAVFCIILGVFFLCFNIYILNGGIASVEIIFSTSIWSILIFVNINKLID